MSVTWIHKPFNELTPGELYAVLQLRNEVFVVEQDCVFQDADNKDQASWHVMAWENDRLVAYSRLVPAGVAFTEASIGRVITAADIRNTGIGKILMQKSIDLVYNIWGRNNIRIGAQFYLLRFYQSLGFQQSSEIYLEDGIKHIEMLLHGYA